MPNPHTIVIVEDEPQIRKHLVRVVDQSEHFTCLAACETLQQACAALSTHKPDILLLDIDLPDGNGLDLIRFAAQQNLDTKSVVVSVFEDSRHVAEAVSNGAIGYVLKDDPLISIEQALLMILGGGAPISPAIARQVLQRFQQEQAKSASPQPDLEKLTAREQEILRLVSEGFTDKEIASQLNVSYHTVTTHVKHIYRKLSVKTRVEATREAIKHGFVSNE